MIKIENTETFGWQAAIRGCIDGACVRTRETKDGKTRYEAYTSAHCKYIPCGTHNSLEEARDAVANVRIAAFLNEIALHGDKPEDIAISKEKGYFVSANGNVYGKNRNFMKLTVGKDGYRHTIVNGKNKNAHRMVAEAFIPNPRNLPCVNHKDGNKLNNAVTNLEWCTHSENTIHAYKNGLEKAGELCASSKLTQTEVDYIREKHKRRDKKFGTNALAKHFGVDRSTISDIVANKSWRKDV